jgi:UDP-glucose 4-epimerase
MIKPILITGASGYIGSHTLVELLQQTEFPVVALDNFDNSSPDTYQKVKIITAKNFDRADINLCDFSLLKSVFEKYNGFSGIIHFAAHKAVGESVDNPIKYYNNNITSLTNLLSLCKEYEVSNFIFSSSCSVYGNVEKLPVTENTPWPKAESPYAYTKQIGERIIEDFCNVNKEFKAIALRYFNPVGAHASALIGESPINKPNNLVPLITMTAAGKNNQLKVFGQDYPTRDGTCIRDYIHVSDIADAHVKALNFLIKEKKSELNFDVFNLGTGNGVSVLEAIRAFEKVSGKKLNYIITDRRPGDVIAVYADNTKAKNILNWIPRYGIDEMMRTAWLWELNRN